MSQQRLAKIITKHLEDTLKHYTPDSTDGKFVQVFVDDADIKHIMAVITGTADTPYENVLFVIDMNMPDNYPFSNPKALYLSSMNTNLRIHPNLYAREQKICLSILGTWNGPSWTPMMSFRTVLVNIQALLNSEPLRCEPGFENAGEKEIEAYNRVARYQGFLVNLNVVENLPIQKWPEPMKEYIKQKFLDTFDRNIELMEELSHADYAGKTLTSFHGTATINYPGTIERYKRVRKTLV